MDCQLNAKICGMALELAREHQQELAQAGTFVDLEELACQIGDELAREFCQQVLNQQAKEAAKEETAVCPDCGSDCPAGPPEPVVLDGLRGELTYNQPSYFCRRCRRSFFPDGGSVGSDIAKHGYPERAEEDGLGRLPLE